MNFLRQSAFYVSILTGFSLSAAKPFALDKLAALKDFKVEKPAYIKASDGADLAYYAFVPSEPKAILLFYHGAGFYGSALYQHFAQELANKYAIGCYLFDIRGHGHSQGARGDTPSSTQVWNDITSAIDYVTKKYPSAPLYLGGHSSGAGLTLNYAGFYNNPAVHGYILVAPYLGRNSGVLKEHTDQATSFIASVRSWVFILNALSGGYLFAHTPAVFFNYPKHLLASDPKIVSSYTPSMTGATSPENPQELFSKLQKPFGLFIAGQDEQFIAPKIAAYKNYAPATIAEQSSVEIIEQAKHLDIMLSVAEQSARCIARMLPQ